MAFLVTEIAMDVMGCKYFDVDGFPVSQFEDLVRYNRAGNLEKSKEMKTLNEYLSGETFFDPKGVRMNLNIDLPQKEKDPEPTTRMSYPPQPVNTRPTVLNPTVPKVASARSLVTNNGTVQTPRPQPQQLQIINPQPAAIRRPSFNNTFSSFIADREKEKTSPPAPVQKNSNSSLFQRSMTQFGMGNLGNRKIVIKPKPVAIRPAPYPPVPVKTIPLKDTPRYHIIQKQTPVHKVVTVRPNAASPMVAGGAGTQYKPPQSLLRINDPRPAASGGGGTQFGAQPYRNEPTPAVSGGSGTQFGVPASKGNDVEPATTTPKIARILHRRHTLFKN